MGTFFEHFNVMNLNGDASVNLVNNVLQQGRVLKTYYSDGVYINHEYGRLQIVLDIQPGEEGNEIVSVDTQCASRDIWELRVGIQPSATESRTRGTRQVVVKRASDGNGLAVVNIINADVLPCYAEDEILTLQMAAFPLMIEYYPNKEAYEDSVPVTRSDKELLDGHQILLEEGMLFPANLLSKHGDTEVNDLTEDIDVMLFRATVREVKKNSVTKDGFYYTVHVTTQFGDLTVVHTEEMVDEEQRKFIIPGSTISCACCLVGDPALFDHAKGAVFNQENGLKLLRHCCMCGEADRLRGALSEEVVYIKDSTQESFSGIHAVVDFIKSIYDGGERCIAVAARIDRVPQDVHALPIGTHCLALIYGNEQRISSLMLAETDQDGKISRIRTVPYIGYHVIYDDEEYYSDDPNETGSKTESAVIRLKRLLMEKIRDDRSMDVRLGIFDGLSQQEREIKAKEIIALIENADDAGEVKEILNKYPL